MMMTLETKRAATVLEAPEAAQIITVSKGNHTSIPKKWERVLGALAAGKSYNRFEAERYLNDHCLHTTVSTLQSMGLLVHREFEEVPGYMNIPTRVCRYWLDRSAENLRKAMALLPASVHGGA